MSQHNEAEWGALLERVLTAGVEPDAPQVRALLSDCDTARKVACRSRQLPQPPRAHTDIPATGRNSTQRDEAALQELLQATIKNAVEQHKDKLLNKLFDKLDGR